MSDAAVQAVHDRVAPGPDVADDVADGVAARLAGLAEQPVAEHAATYDEVHRLLLEALGRLERE